MPETEAKGGQVQSIQHAAAAAQQLPSQFRSGFISAFQTAARSGFEVGSGQSGSTLDLPSGVPQAVAQQLHALACGVFQQSFVDAMWPTMALPITVILAMAFATAVLARARARTPAYEQSDEAVAAAL